MKNFLLIGAIALGTGFCASAQTTITAKGKNNTTIETDGDKTTTTITCDSWYNEECYKMVIGGPVIVKGVHTQLTTYQNRSFPQVQEGTLEEGNYGKDFLNVTLIKD